MGALEISFAHDALFEWNVRPNVRLTACTAAASDISESSTAPADPHTGRTHAFRSMFMRVPASPFRQISEWGRKSIGCEAGIVCLV